MTKTPRRAKFTLDRTSRCIVCNRPASCWGGHVHRTGKSILLVAAGWCSKHEVVVRFDRKLNKSVLRYWVPRPIKNCPFPETCHGYNKRRYGHSTFIKMTKKRVTI